MLELNKIYNLSCEIGLKQLDNESIDLTVTSPPYDNLRDYKGYSFDFETIAKELFRVTKKGGVVVWVVGDATINGSETGTSFKQALYFKEIGFNLHDTMIYVKDVRYPRNNAYGNAFEYMFILSKGTPKCFNAIQRETLNKAKNKLVTERKKDGTLIAKRYEKSSETSAMYNVWYYSNGFMKTTKEKYAYEHPAMFPEQLVADHINSWSNENETV